MQAYPQWPFMEKDGSVYRMPKGTPRLPIMYTRPARKLGSISVCEGCLRAT